ncbi:hypothetical protein BH09PAT1_BH09PAT1_4400 [soil metagenome]
MVKKDTADMSDEISKLHQQIKDLESRQFQYKQLIDASPEAVAIHSEGILLYVNKAAVRLMGAKSAKRLLNRSIIEFVHPDFHDVVKKRVKELYATNKATKPMEEKFIRVDKKVIDVEVISMPIMYEGKKAIQIAVRDISDRKRSFRKLLFQAQTIENLSDAVIVMGKDQTIMSWNKGASLLYGWGEKEVIGKKLAAIIPYTYIIGSDKESAEQIAKHGLWKGQIHQKNKNGKSLIINISASAVYEQDGKIIGFVTINRDVTDELASQGRLSAIIESSDDAIVSKTLDGVIKSWNNSAEKMFGYKSEEAIGQSITLIIPPELRKEEKEIINRLRKGEKIHHFETVRMGKSGNKINVSLSISPVKNNRGEIIGASKIARDVTERLRTEKALTESEERLRIALDVGKIGVWDWNMQTNDLLWTDNVYTIHGVSKQTFHLSLENYLKLIHPGDLAIFEKTLQNSIENKSHFVVTVRVSSPEGQRWISTSAKIFYDKGKAVRMLGATSDITKQRQLDQEKSDFLSMASHELKTPLTSMKMFIDLLARELTLLDKTSIKPTYYAERIKDQANRLAELTNDLLDVSRIETGKLRLNKETFDLTQLIKDTIESIQATTNTHEIIMKSDEVLEVEADRYRIYQVLVNLLTNAIKYSLKSGKIIVDIQLKGSKVEVSVKDFGIGIKKDLQKKIFERLYQVTDPEEKTYPGLGLGLYITKEIMDRHDGEIWVESKKGEGSTFFFSLPK